MASFQVQFNIQEFQRQLDGMLDAAKELFERSKRVTFSAKDAGTIVQAFLVWDDQVDAFGLHCGESGEKTFSNYYAAKAVAYALTGNKAGGTQYFDKARTRRTGGDFDPWLRTVGYYR